MALIAGCLLALPCAGALAASQNHSPFSAQQLKQLRAWSVTPVYPSYVPAGFKLVQPVHLDGAARSYQLTYKGPGGASFIFEGAAAGHSAAPTPVPTHHKNIFSSIGSLFNHHPSNSEGLAGESEANPNQDVAADSPVIGAAHFKETKPDCATGVGDKTIAGASYALTGCNTSADDLVRIYRSAKVVQGH